MALEESLISTSPVVSSEMTQQSENGPSQLSPKKRYLSIDLFRGLAIVGMVFVNTLTVFTTTPWWSKHAADFGLTYVDLIAPFFIFAIALTYKLSFSRAVQKEGFLKAYVRFLRRYAALLGFGFLGALIIEPTGITFDWGVLQAIGFAGILTLFFIILPRFYRFAISVVLLLLYQFLLGLTVSIDGILVTIGDLAFTSSHGGIIGGVGYGLMMLLSTAVVDDFRSSDKTLLLIAGGCFSVLGGGLHYLWKYLDYPLYGGISKHRVTLSYILLTVGLSALLFWFIWFLFDKKDLSHGKSYFLQPIGRNSLFLYMLHPLFIELLFLLFKATAHVALAFFSGFVTVSIVWLVAWLLDKKKIYIVL
ncbi:MAG: heparan-alpha-glucosaminide N-acetyltransferase domain-containing protein [Candidatus Heimdallarchaeota archaeon]